VADGSAARLAAGTSVGMAAAQSSGGGPVGPGPTGGADGAIPLPAPGWLPHGEGRGSGAGSSQAGEPGPGQAVVWSGAGGGAGCGSSSQEVEAGWSHSAWVEGSSSDGQTKERSLGSQLCVVSSNGQAAAGGSGGPCSGNGSAGGVSQIGSCWAALRRYSSPNNAG
jgi:hypothetical protein